MGAERNYFNKERHNRLPTTDFDVIAMHPILHNPDQSLILIFHDYYSQRLSEFLSVLSMNIKKSRVMVKEE